MKDKIEQAIARLQELNAQDPNECVVDGQKQKKEVIFAERLAVWVHKVAPEPSAALQVAAYGQHVERWKLARSDYAEGRVGYLKWRKDLSKHHAQVTTKVAEEVGLPEDVVTAIRRINLKEDLKGNPESQVMEDALCLSFLEHEFGDFIEKYDDEKVIDIVQKTWRKMSERGHELALALPISGRALELVQRALS